MGLGKKYYNLDQPPPSTVISYAGSGLLILTSATSITDPTLSSSAGSHSATSAGIPTFDAPTVVWT